MYPQMSEGDNVEGNNNEEEGNEAKEDKSEDFYDYEMSRKNDEEYFLDHKVINENETEDELKELAALSVNMENGINKNTIRDVDEMPINSIKEEQQLAEMDLSKFEVTIDVAVSGYLNYRFSQNNVTDRHPN
ncbi:hypothetical protein DINM_005516 [Dirofilaria immitis]|nr:hypothetical protein [Dirofilaria immitis]